MAGWCHRLGAVRGWMCHQPHESSVNIKQPQACQTGFQARAAWRPVLTSNQAGSACHDCPQPHSGCAWPGSVADRALQAFAHARMLNLPQPPGRVVPKPTA